MSSANPNIVGMTGDSTGTSVDNPWQSSSGEVAAQAEQNVSDSGDAKRDVKRGVLALVDQAVCSATNFLTMAMLARSLSMTVFGVFSLAFLCFQYARTIQERTMAAPYLVFTHRPDQDSRTLLGSNLVHQAIFATVAFIVALTAGFGLISFSSLPDLGYALLALSPAIPFLLLRDQLRAVSLAHFRMEVSLAMNIAVAILQLGGIGFLVFTGRVTIPSVMAVFGVACLIPALLWFRVRPLGFSVDRSRLFSDWKTFWNFSRWLVVARAFGMGGQYTVPAMVAYYMEPASVGAFATCTALVGLSMMFILGLNNYAQPRIIVAYQEQGTPGMLRAVLQTVVCFAVCLGGAAALLFFFGDHLLAMIYGSKYSSYGVIAALLSLSMLTVSVSIAFQNGLAALGKPHGFLLGELSFFATAVTLALFLIPRWGLMGAAWSLVAAGAVVSVVTIATLFWLLKQDAVGREISTSKASGN